MPLLFFTYLLTYLHVAVTHFPTVQSSMALWLKWQTIILKSPNGNLSSLFIVIIICLTIRFHLLLRAIITV